jgi:hypothetical protein
MERPGERSRVATSIPLIFFADTVIASMAVGRHLVYIEFNRLRVTLLAHGCIVGFVRVIAGYETPAQVGPAALTVRLVRDYEQYLASLGNRDITV